MSYSESFSSASCTPRPSIHSSLNTPLTLSATIPPPDGGYGWFVVAATCIVVLLVDGTAMACGVLQAEFQHISGPCSGLAPGGRTRLSLSSAFLCSLPLLCAPLAALIAHEIGARLLIFVGGSLSAVGCALAALFAKTPEHVTFSLGLFAGLGLACVYIPVLLTAAQYFERRRALVMGLIATSSGVGALLMAPLLAWLLPMYGWRGTVMLLGGMLLQVCVCGAVLQPLNIQEVCDMEPQRRLLRRLERLSMQSGLGDSIITLEYQKEDTRTKIQTLHRLLTSGQEKEAAALRRDDAVTENTKCSEMFFDSCSSCSSVNDEYQLVDANSEKSSEKENVSIPEGNKQCGNSLWLASYFPNINIRAVSDVLCGPLNDSYRLLPLFQEKILPIIPENEVLELHFDLPSPEPNQLFNLEPDHYSAILDLSNSALDENISPLGSRGRSVSGLLGGWSSGSGDQLLVGRSAGGSGGNLLSIRRCRSYEMLHLSNGPVELQQRSCSDPELAASVESEIKVESVSTVSQVHQDPRYQRRLTEVMRRQQRLNQNAKEEAAGLWDLSDYNLYPAQLSTSLTAISSKHLFEEVQNSCLTHSSRAHRICDKWRRWHQNQRQCSPLRRLDIFYRGNLAQRTAPPTRAQMQCRFANKPSSITQYHCNEAQLYPSSYLASSHRLLHRLLSFTILRSRALCLLLLSNFLVTLAAGALILHLPDLAMTQGLSSEYAALLLSVMGGGRAVGQLALGLLGLADRPGLDRALLYTFCITGCGLITFLAPLLHSFVFLTLFAALFGFFLSAGDALPWILLVELLDLEQLTNSSCWLLMCRGVGQLLGGPLFAFTIDVFNGDFKSGVFGVAIVMCLAGLIMLAEPLLLRHGSAGDLSHDNAEDQASCQLMHPTSDSPTTSSHEYTC